MKTFQLTVIFPDNEDITVECVSLNIPTKDGYFGIMADRAPCVIAVGDGIPYYIDKDGKKNILEDKYKILTFDGVKAKIFC